MGMFFLILAAIFMFYLAYGQYANYERIRYARRLESEQNIEQNIFGAMVALMAKVAKADGRVSELEAELIGNVLNDFSASFSSPDAAKERLKAIFNEEKNSPTAAREWADRFALLSQHATYQRKQFFEFLMTLAFADGIFTSQERQMLLGISQSIGISAELFYQYEQIFSGTYEQAHRAEQSPNALQEAYRTLGVESSESMQSIKRAYRKLVKEHHPDIARGEGRNEDEVELANRKLQEINAAYEIIKQRG